MFFNNQKFLGTDSKKAFTIVELMLALVVLSLIVASSVSIITRRHKLIPRKTLHGKYFCFNKLERDENGHVTSSTPYEILYSGKQILKNGPANDGVCSFDSPKNSSYLYVQIIGAGGAGGNADFEVNPKEPEVVGSMVPILYYLGSNKISKIKYTPKNDTWSTPDNVLGEIAVDYYATHNKNNAPSYILKENDLNNFTFSDKNIPFPGKLHKYILQTVAGIRTFAYDYAGKGARGYGYKVVASSGTYYCKCNKNYDGSYRTFDFGSCGTYCESENSENKLNPFTETCQFLNGDDPSHCPEVYTKRAGFETDPLNIKGQEGTKGGPFATSLYQYDYNLYPVLGNTSYLGRYKLNFVVGDVDVDRYLDPNYTSDWVLDVVKTSNTIEVDWKAGDVVPGKYKACDSPDGTGCDSTKTYKLWKSYPVRYEFETFPKYLGLNDANKMVGSKLYNKEKIILPTYPEIKDTPLDGDYPYFGSKIPGSERGVKLHHGDELTSAEKITKNNVSPIGKAGTNLSPDNMGNLLNKDGTDTGWRPAAHESVATDNPAKLPDEYVGNNTSCFSHLGLVFKDSSVPENVFHVPANSTCPSIGYDDTIYTSLKESVYLYTQNYAMAVAYYYKTIKLSHGEGGKAGQVKALFARSFNNSAIKLTPGVAGKYVESSEDHKYGGSGGKSMLEFNCNDAGNCSGKIIAGGGLGGRSWIQDTDDSYTNNTNRIKDFENNNITKDKLSKDSQTEDGQVSEFSSLLRLIDLTNLTETLKAEIQKIGNGGNGGYVNHKCFVTPQYFKIKNYHMIDSSATDDILPNYPSVDSYTKLSDDMIKGVCGNNYMDDYEEFLGEDGYSGAIVITW